MKLELSPQAVQLIATLFAVNSPMQLPVGAAEVVLEIRNATQVAMLEPQPQEGSA